MGLTRSDVVQMPWGELVLMMQARADSYEEDDDGVREGTWDDIKAWL